MMENNLMKVILQLLIYRIQEQ